MKLPETEGGESYSSKAARSANQRPGSSPANDIDLAALSVARPFPFFVLCMIFFILFDSVFLLGFVTCAIQLSARVSARDPQPGWQNRNRPRRERPPKLPDCQRFESVLHAILSSHC